MNVVDMEESAAAEAEAMMDGGPDFELVSGKTAAPAVRRLPVMRAPVFGGLRAEKMSLFAALIFDRAAASIHSIALCCPPSLSAYVCCGTTLGTKATDRRRYCCRSRRRSDHQDANQGAGEGQVHARRGRLVTQVSRPTIRRNRGDDAALGRIP